MNASQTEQPGSHRLRPRLWRGVTLQLFLVAILPLTVLVIVVTFGSLELHHRAMRSLVADRNLLAVQSAAAGLGKAITNRSETLALVAEMAGASGATGTQLDAIADRLALFEGGVALIDASGQLAARSGSEAVAVLAAQPEWEGLFAAIRATPPGQAGYLPVQRVAEVAYLPVYVRRADGATMLGLIVPAGILRNGLQVVSGNEPVTVIVVDAGFQVLYQSGSLTREENLPTHPGIRSALAGLSQIDYLQTGSGEHVVTSSPILPVGWALMIEESWEDIASPLLRATQYAPLIIVPILALSLLALWFGLRQIVQPMRALEEKAADLARGDFKSIRQPVGGVGEIRHLQSTLADMATQLKEAQNSLHSYIGAITDSVENERRNLARELHDETLQTMIALGQYTQYALHWNSDPKVEKTLNQVVELTDQGTQTLRRLVRGLRPIYIEDLGLVTALGMQASQPDQPGGVEVHFESSGEERRLKPEVEMALYRMAQEALSNIRRHAGAAHAWIRLHFEPGEVVLEVRDDGRGFSMPPDPLQLARQGHYGLLGLHERAELIGATLSIHSEEGHGTTIRIRLSG